MSLPFPIRRAAVVALALLTLAGGTLPASARAGVAALALWSDQGVFRSEAGRAAHILAARYGGGGRVVLRANSRGSFAAGPRGIAEAVAAASRGLDPERDVLFVVLSSHGSPEGIAEKGGGREGLLAPGVLGQILATSPVRQKVLIVSACYAGIFGALAGPDTLVITAADADHPSFGCEAGATWTYFGDAFFNRALRQAPAGEPLPQIFARASSFVRARENAQGFEPSNPQFYGGADVLRTLDR